MSGYRVAAAVPARPNIVLITTDDMRRSDLQWMPETLNLLAAHGVRMSQFISNHPLCCPARAEILTGQHSHNNGVRSNVGPEGGYKALAQELYDLFRDPAQLQNVAGAAAYAGVKAGLAARLSVLETCVGVSCQSGGLPAPSG